MKKGKCSYRSGTEKRAQRKIEAEKQKRATASPQALWHSASVSSAGGAECREPRCVCAAPVAAGRHFRTTAGCVSLLLPKNRRRWLRACSWSSHGKPVRVRAWQLRRLWAGCRGSCCSCCRATWGTWRWRLGADSARSVRANSGAPGRHSRQLPGGNGEAGKCYTWEVILLYSIFKLSNLFILCSAKRGQDSAGGGESVLDQHTHELLILQVLIHVHVSSFLPGRFSLYFSFWCLVSIPGCDA